MTYQANQCAFVPDWEACFAPLRNDWLDSFAQLELEICRALARLQGNRAIKPKQFSQQVAELTSLKPSSRCSSAAAHKLKEIAVECEQLATIRASIVHSVMIRGARQDVAAALFQNTNDVVRNTPVYLIMTAEDFHATRKSLVRLAQQLKSLS